MPQVTGSFDVRLTPQEADSRAEAAFLARLAIDKRFLGPLEATSAGQMLATQDGAVGSGGYVALEQVVGTLDGRRGGFVLQHSGHMVRNQTSLEINVVADTGTGELAGLAGTMAIEIDADGAHTYAFDYTLPG